MQLLKALCCFLVMVIHAQLLKEGQLAAGTCEIVTLDWDSSQPRRTITRQTARCACRKGQIAGTTRARPACVDGESPGSPGSGPHPHPHPLAAGSAGSDPDGCPHTRVLGPSRAARVAGRWDSHVPGLLWAAAATAGAPAGLCVAAHELFCE